MNLFQILRTGRIWGRMSSLSSDPGFLELSFRKECIAEEESVIISEISEVIENLKQKHPDCDRLAQINASIAHCKNKLTEIIDEEHSPLKQCYMDHVVKLGLERQSLEDVGSSCARLQRKGHDFVLQSARGRHNPCCEVCMHTIWRLVQAWRRCSACGLRTHDKCATVIERPCAALAVASREFSINLTLSEEKGLSSQGYACAECKSPLMYEGPAHMEPRLCDYSSLLFCPNCHWGDRWSIPARIVLNMDSSPRPVCRAVKQMLSIIDTRPLINLSLVNQALFKYHKDLQRVQQLRKNFLFMKCYFISCQTARKLRILQYLHAHQHFVENSDMYSLKELRDLCQGDLLPALEDIHTVFRKHIEEECETCKGNGFYCELCDDPTMKDEILFPFSGSISMCQQCCAVFHAKCFERNSSHCPRCERRRKRSPFNASSTVSA